VVDVARDADVVVLAVPVNAAADVLDQLGHPDPSPDRVRRGHGLSEVLLQHFSMPNSLP
jgi:hypothetical protein